MDRIYSFSSFYILSWRWMRYGEFCLISGIIYWTINDDFHRVLNFGLRSYPNLSSRPRRLDILGVQMWEVVYSRINGNENEIKRTDYSFMSAMIKRGPGTLLTSSVFSDPNEYGH